MKTPTTPPTQKRIQGEKQQIQTCWTSREREVRHRLARMRQRQLLNAMFDAECGDDHYDK